MIFFVFSFFFHFSPFKLNKRLLVQIFGIGLCDRVVQFEAGYKSGHGPHYTRSLPFFRPLFSWDRKLAPPREKLLLT